jgi:hypothetical protein
MIFNLFSYLKKILNCHFLFFLKFNNDELIDKIFDLGIFYLDIQDTKTCFSISNFFENFLDTKKFKNFNNDIATLFNEKIIYFSSKLITQALTIYFLNESINSISMPKIIFAYLKYSNILQTFFLNFFFIPNSKIKKISQNQKNFFIKKLLTCNSQNQVKDILFQIKNIMNTK